MIRSVAGRLAAVEPEGPVLVLEVGGVGLGLRVSATTLRGLPPTGAEARLLTHLLVREDALDLYGFASAAERALFESLITVSGVGPRVALAICGLAEADEVRLAIATGDAGRIRAAPGVGKRLAERVVVDLRERMGALNGSAPPASASPLDGLAAAREGLAGLGFRPEEAEAALRDAPAGLDAEALLRHALEALRRR